MKIAILNGSPKGMNSVTMQYMKYLENRFSEHSFSYLTVAGRIGVLERRPEELARVIEEVRTSDLVFWAFPLYYMLCCSQYKRFIELLYEEGRDSFRGIPAAALTTSIKFYDHTAHNYIREVCRDLGMPFCGGYSAESSDLFKEEERQRLKGFFESVTERVETRRFYQEPIGIADSEPLEYCPGGADPVATEGKWLVLADLKGSGHNLRNMVNRFMGASGNRAELVDISRIDFKPCTGCCRCGPDNICTFGDDNFVKLHRDRVMKADVILIAGEIRDRYLSSTWKRFFDRSFYMGHTPSLKGKQAGFLISGSLSSRQNLKEILVSWAEFQGVGMADIVTDETPSSEDLDMAIDSLVASLERNRARGYFPPDTFRHVGGMKLFRDYIWGELRPLFQADHRYYRKNGLYDFPQNSFRTRIINLILPPILKLPPVKRKMLQKMPGAMTMRFRKIVSPES